MGNIRRDAAHLVGRKLNRSAAAPFFAIAIEAPAETNVAACTDPDLTDAVIAALSRPPDWDEAKAAEALTDGTGVRLRGPASLSPSWL